jgi:hypothetical protein
MDASKWQQGLVLIVLMNMAWTTGCTSLQAVSVGDNPPQTLPVAVGQSVRITTKDGRKESFKVTAVEPDALVGQKVRVRYEEIAVLEVRQNDQGKSIALIAVSVLGAAVVTALLLDAFSDFGALAASGY